MMMSPILAIALILAVGAPTVNLGYSKYQGNALQNRDDFLGMRYAAPAAARRLVRRQTAKKTDHFQICRLTGQARKFTK
jgi:hypothetical protein